MLISIKSEIDSRVLLYPLIKVLKPFGSILVITSNRQLNRLIEDVDTRTCRDITIILDADGTADDTAGNTDTSSDASAQDAAGNTDGTSQDEIAIENGYYDEYGNWISY